MTFKNVLSNLNFLQSMMIKQGYRVLTSDYLLFSSLCRDCKCKLFFRKLSLTNERTNKITKVLKLENLNGRLPDFRPLILLPFPSIFSPKWNFSFRKYTFKWVILNVDQLVTESKKHQLKKTFGKTKKNQFF